jgi:glycosyltransferase involved in cell wall biosynthesis
VIVDDGSDPPVSMDSAASAGDVALIRQENQGVAAARNHGVAAVAGEFLAFLDQDDEWLPEKLAQQVSFMRRHDLVMCDTEFNISGNGQILATGYEYHQGDFRRLLSTARMGLSTLMLRRDAFACVGGFDEVFRVATDWELQLRVASTGLKFDRVPEVLCAIHLHGQNASSDYRAMYREQTAILHRYATDTRPAVREAARRGRKRMRELYAYQAIDTFRSTREPGHLVWAAQRAPRVVAHSVLAKTVGRKSA